VGVPGGRDQDLGSFLKISEVEQANLRVKFVITKLSIHLTAVTSPFALPVQSRFFCWREIA